jgi:hypothetical protein
LFARMVRSLKFVWGDVVYFSGFLRKRTGKPGDKVT